MTTKFDELSGVGMAQRMLAKAATPTVSYALNGGEWTVVTTGMKDTTMKFKCGIEQEDDTPDGRKVKASSIWPPLFLSSCIKCNVN